MALMQGITETKVPVEPMWFSLELRTQRKLQLLSTQKVGLSKQGTDAGLQIVIRPCYLFGNFIVHEILHALLTYMHGCGWYDCILFYLFTVGT